jgi:hypothetical protein
MHQKWPKIDVKSRASIKIQIILCDGSYDSHETYRRSGDYRRDIYSSLTLHPLTVVP